MKRDSHISEIQLKYKPQPLTNSMKNSNEVYQFLISDVYDEDTIGYKETFKILLLNTANKIVGYSTISVGGLTSCPVDIRVILQTALISNAIAIIATHNHPSGNFKPSNQDDNLTKNIAQACKSIDLKLLDHLIITPENGYYSYRDEGKL